MLTEFGIKAQTTPQIFERGKAYFKDGAIFDARIMGNVISAKCTGSYAPHYKVRAKLDEGAIESATCTCEYEYEGCCKHVVAMLLAYLHQPEMFGVSPLPAELFADLTREELVGLVSHLMEESDDAQELAEKWMAKRAGKKKRKK